MAIMNAGVGRPLFHTAIAIGAGAAISAAMSQPQSPDRFNEDAATYAVKGSDAPDLNTGVAAIRNVAAGQSLLDPASTAQVAQQDAVDSRGIPMGGRIQLDPSWDVERSALSPAR